MLTMPHRRFALPTLVLAWLGAACGSVDRAPSEDTSGAGAAGSTSGTGATGGEGEDCAAYADQTGTATVTLRIVNQTPQDVFLGSNCGGPEVDLHWEGGEDIWPSPGFCGSTCEDLQSAPAIYCGPPCLQQAIRIPAGGTREVQWDGSYDATVDMPTDCYARAGDDLGQCLQVLAAPARQYQVGVIGYAGCDAGGGAPCVCDDDNRCQGQAGGQQVTTEAAGFPFPAQLSVDAVFGPCAFGCPDGAAATPVGGGESAPRRQRD